jgi:dTDP-4-dehydrorhamnose 3,5-epimerase
MHFQDEPFGQTKLVAALSGVVYDVAIDLRPESPAFRRWVGVELSADNNRALYVPIGCAHGYQTLTDSASVFYFVSRPYSAPHGRGVRWNDPAFGVSWPLGTPTKIHPRDANYPDFEY